MSDSRIDYRAPVIRPTPAVARVGTATDRRPRRQEGEDKRDGNRKRRQLYDLLFEEIDRVDELEANQRERLKRNIRAHLALRARSERAVETAISEASAAGAAMAATAASAPPPPSFDPKTDDDQSEDNEKASGGASANLAAYDAQPHEEPNTDHLINVAAPQHPDLPPEELEQNAILAQQLRDCLSRPGEAARKVAIYLHLLLSIDGALAPHVIVEI